MIFFSAGSSAGGSVLPIPGGRAQGYRSLADRLLSPFAEIRPGEASGALLLALNLFVLLASYYLLKTVREALILTEGGAAIKSYSAAGQSLLLLLVIPLYGRLGSRWPRMPLVVGVTLFFVMNLVAFATAGMTGVHVGIAFFLWVGIFNVFIISQFWAFANDLYNEERGKRLFPIVGVGSSLGAWMGALAAAQLFKNVGPYTVMMLAAAFLAASLLLTVLVNRRESQRAPDQRQRSQQPLGKEGGFQLIFRDRYLLLIALLIMVLNIVNTTGEFILGDLVVEEANRVIGAGEDTAGQRAQFIGAFYGSFFTWVNGLGLFLQLFVVSRLFDKVGVRGALFVLPLIAFGGYGLLLIAPGLAIVRFTKILENATDYSIQNTTKQALFLPTSREAKYKAKAAADTFFWRAGDMLQAVIVAIGTSLGFATRNFAMVNMALVLVWLVIVAGLYREHKRITRDQPAAA